MNIRHWDTSGSKVRTSFSRIFGYGIPRLLVITSFIFLFCPLESQTYSEVDSTTYQLYLDKSWDELIHVGKDAVKKDIDYYFLRMRIGIAYYEKNNYKSAQSHFRKALEFNTGDPVASEYLYYAYLFGGQTQQAALLYREFPESLKMKVQEPGLKTIDLISVEYLYNRSFTDELADDPGTFESLPYGAQILTRDFQNLNLALHHNMHPGTTFRHAYTYLVKDNYYYYDDGLDRFTAEGQMVRQHQYFLSPSFTFQGGLVISPSFHFLHVGFQIPELSGGGPGPGGGNDVIFRKDFVNQMAGGLQLARYLGTLLVRLEGIYSNLNKTDQLSGTAGFTWYPAGNLDMYMGASLHAHMADLDAGKAALIPDIIFGYGIASRVWVEFSGTYGDMKNFSESNGYIVYNGLDWMTYKAMGNIMVPLTDKGSMIYAGVRYAGYENQFIPFDPAQPADLNDLKYNSLSIYGGLSWKF